MDGKKKINGHWELDYGDFFFHFRDTKSLDVLSLLSSIIDFQCTFSHLQCSAEMGKQHKMTLLCSDGNRVPRRDSRNSHTSTKGGLISEGISLRLKSPNNGAKSWSRAFSLKVDSAQDRDLAPFFLEIWAKVKKPFLD